MVDGSEYGGGKGGRHLDGQGDRRNGGQHSHSEGETLLGEKRDSEDKFSPQFGDRGGEGGRPALLITIPGENSSVYENSPIVEDNLYVDDDNRCEEGQCRSLDRWIDAFEEEVTCKETKECEKLCDKDYYSDYTDDYTCK